MELYPLQSVALAELSRTLLDDLDATAHKVNELRPLETAVVGGILNELMSTRVHSSNAIEGNTLSLGETREILATGQIYHGFKNREATEVINLGRAIDFATSTLIPVTSPFTVENLLEGHRLLLTGINDAIAGVFRSHRVMIAGAKRQPPAQDHVPGLVDHLLEQLSSPSDVHPLVQAVWAHWALARIHPFVDGNGRTARLWQDVVLLRNRLTCAIVPLEFKQEYLKCLGEADDGDFNPLIQLIAQRVTATFDLYIGAQQKADAIGEWARNVAGEAQIRADEQRTMAYLLWQRQMEKLRYEFERCAAAVSRASTEITVHFRPYPLIDQAAWECIRTGEGARKTWFFIINFRRGHARWNYIFFFGKHVWSDVDTDEDQQEPRVCLLVSEQEGHGPSKLLADDRTSSPVSLREIFRVGDNFVRGRYDPMNAANARDETHDPAQIAREFIQEVILRRLT